MSPTSAIVLDRHYKGFPTAAEPCCLDKIAERRWNILAGDLPFPIALLRDSALRHNVAWMQAFARQQGVDIAPHGKTTMSPELYRRQIEAGGGAEEDVTALDTPGDATAALSTPALNCRQGDVAGAHEDGALVVLAGQDASLDTALLLERKAFNLLFASQDQKEGARAFLEKRPPNYTGN